MIILAAAAMVEKFTAAEKRNGAPVQGPSASYCGQSSRTALLAAGGWRSTLLLSTNSCRNVFASSSVSYKVPGIKNFSWSFPGYGVISKVFFFPTYVCVPSRKGRGASKEGLPG